eukprot:6464584-Amphidinium_carterae.2
MITVAIPKLFALCGALAQYKRSGSFMSSGHARAAYSSNRDRPVCKPQRAGKCRSCNDTRSVCQKFDSHCKQYVAVFQTTHEDV